MSIPNIGAILASPAQIGGTQLETAVAKAYLFQHADDFDRVEFNVGLGPGLDLGTGFAPYVQKSATASTKPRADMILYRGNTATIVEVKGRINPSALGQLLTYWHFLTMDNPQLMQVYKVVAGQSIQEGLQALWQQYAVQVELFPDVAVPVSTNA